MPSWFKHDLGLGDRGLDVQHLQTLLGTTPDGAFDECTAALVRGLQRKEELPVTGIVDAETASKLGERASKGLTPEWFTRTIALWESGPDVRRVRALLQLNDDDRFDPDAEAAVRRLQSEHGLPLTGEVDEAAAVLLGD